MSEDRERIEARLAASFREACEATEPVTAARLAAARRRAVEAARRPRPAPWLPALAAAAAGVLAVAVWWRPAAGPAPSVDVEAVEMFIDEHHDMFLEDPDFYLWLEVAAEEG